MNTETRVVLLGTGTPNSEVDRSGSCVAVMVKGRSYLFDAGPGIVRRARAEYELGSIELKPSDLDRVFLTHLHSDHTTGLPDLLLAPWVLGRKRPLEVIGPRGSRKMMENIHNAYREDIRVRTRGPERANDEGHGFSVSEIKEGEVYSDDLITVHAFRVRHTTFRDSFGYRLITPGRTMVISGDCAVTPETEDHYRDLDLLVHEVYSSGAFKERSEKWRNYHKGAHTSAEKLGKVLSRVRPELTVLYHQLLWGASEENLMREIRSVYDGKVIIGKDLMVI